ncbi:Ribonuclease H-like superfamily [Arabidopsis thaliana x Arabidopsis arenosa]|uniref:Ribonuclease H-like superfamily n=1 Tax=Arabidopsis thaliana x Arabidopsis arenosa TaxID=1240361 RepID=A0A8T2C6E5_9BRAS|nr:Ribonuclease H-like superfamily [Arabidopsis thaliana x Arabidopsis arenosa]
MPNRKKFQLSSGVPQHYWTDLALRSIGSEVGTVESVDVEDVRVRVHVNALQPIEKKIPILLPSGETTMVDLEYERLEKHCFLCSSLSHEKKDCKDRHPRSRREDLSPDSNQKNTLHRIEEGKRRQDSRRVVNRGHPSGTDRHLTSPRRTEVRSPRRRSPVRYSHFQGRERISPSRRDKDSSRRFERYHRGERREPQRSSFAGTTHGRNRSQLHDRVSASKRSVSVERRRWSPIPPRSFQATNSSPGRRQVTECRVSGSQREEILNTPPPAGRPSQLPPRSEIREDSQGLANSRRPALERLSGGDHITVTRQVPRISSSMSGRLQDVNIHYLGEEEQEPILQNSSRHIGSSSAPFHPTLGHRLSLNQGDGIEESRPHVSLRLEAPQPEVTVSIPAKPPKKRTVAKKKAVGPTVPRGVKSPLQGVSLRKRNAMLYAGNGGSPSYQKGEAEGDGGFSKSTKSSSLVVVSWNCQGLGSTLTVPRIKEILAEFSPNILFLMETKNQDDVVSHAFESMGFVHKFTVPPQGLSGGLALFWKNDVLLEILSSSQNFIDSKLKFQNSASFITFTYGAPQVENRASVWDEISALGAAREDAWLLTGDFNEILDNSEKVGGPVRAEGSFIPFRSFVSQNGLWDVQHVGNMLSWRGQRHTHFILSRLDRALANVSWSEKYPSGRCRYLRFEGSDHRPLVTYFDPTKVRAKGVFRFDRRLREKVEIRELVSESWRARETESLVSKFNRCRRDLIAWTKEQLQLKVQDIKVDQEALESALSALVPDNDLISVLTEKLAAAYAEEESLWRQRSRIIWLQEGDKNTGFFHAVTRGRKALNHLSVIEDEDGTELFDEKQIAASVSAYYDKLFKSASGRQLEVVEEAIQPQITEFMNSKLITSPSAKEIHEAVLDIHADKAPGPDGFSAGFYHSFWEIIGLEVVREIKAFFDSGQLQQLHNDTHIRLIPKIPGPTKVADYRPIALCSVHYKIIAKLLSKRLQPLLPNLISKHQSAFVPGRAISDNVLITHEVLHFLRISEAKVHCSMAVKTDMSKAYDRIEWAFLAAVLKRFGFHDKWINWVMVCVSSVTYSFLINGSPQGKVFPSRGLRQGDPLSPYLFILCTEVLSGLCLNAQKKGTLPGVRVAQASGQCINATKSGITFSAKTPPEVKERVKLALGITNEGGVGKYLGLPEHFGRRKKDIFTAIVDKIRQRSLSWTNRFLSAAGKQVLLKAVLAAMPSYAMSCFKLPLSLCKRIQSALTRFWWDDKPEKKKMCWVAWEKLTFPKEEGGLGFREIATFNDALLAKIGWKLLHQPDSLLSQVLLGKYCHSSSFMESKSPSNASHGWRGILAGREILKQGLGWIVGNGESINVWTSPWLSPTSPKLPLGPPPLLLVDLKVKDLLHPNSTSWNLEAIRHHVPHHEEDILKLVLSSVVKPDRLRWLPVKAGSYTTKSGYALGKSASSQEHEVTFNWRSHVWKVSTSPKLKMFLWKLARNALPVGTLLASRGISANTTCKKCGGVEDPTHIFFHCPFAKQVWDAVPCLALPQLEIGVSLKALLVGLQQLVSLPPVGLSTKPLFPWVLWFLWKARNSLVFENRLVSAEDTILKAVKEARSWQEAKALKFAQKCGHSVVPRTEAHPEALVCFSDAAWRKEKNHCGIGWHISDPHLSPILQGSSSRPFVTSVLIAEALAVKAVMRAASDLGATRLACFSDCQELVLLLNSNGHANELDGILTDIVSIRSQLLSVSFHFVPRAENALADALAKTALLSCTSSSFTGV